IPFFELPRQASPIVPHKYILLFAILAIGVAFLGQWFEHLGEHALTPDVSAWWMLPFALLLGGIATMPFVAKHFWEKHYHHVSIALALLVSVYYLFFLSVAGHEAPAEWSLSGYFESHAGASVGKSFGEYISFIFLLGSLFT